MGFGERFLNCCKIHWNGLFYFFSPLVLLPLIFLEPIKEYRTLFLILWSFIWYVVDVVPVGIIGLLPIIFFPILGVLSSQDVCMSYARNSQMILLLTTFIGVALQHSNLTKRYAYIILHGLSFDPKIVLVILMVLSHNLAAFFPAGFVCALMIPTTKAILQMLDDISVCKAIDESVTVKDDELPYPSKVANAFFIGVAYAINIGSIATAISSDAGLVLREVVKNGTALSNMHDNFHLKYAAISFLLSFILLVFTIFYLLFIFMGFKFGGSDTAQQVIYNKEASKTTLEIVGSELPHYNTHMVLTSTLYFLSLIGVLVVSFLAPEINNKVLKFSFNAMFLCFLYFILPSNCDFCNYFKCSKPTVYKPAPNILPWGIASKLTPWKYFFVFGSSLAMGLAMKTSALHLFICDGLMKIMNLKAQQLGFMGITIVMTIMGSNDFVAEIMLNMGITALGRNAPSLLLYPITWCCSLTFLLPVSSLANCYVAGWGNLRAKDMILAGIGPTIFGYLIAFLFALVMGSISWYN